jgi:hypothetical protein
MTIMISLHFLTYSDWWCRLATKQLSIKTKTFLVFGSMCTEQIL